MFCPLTAPTWPLGPTLSLFTLQLNLTAKSKILLSPLICGVVDKLYLLF